LFGLACLQPTDIWAHGTSIDADELVWSANSKKSDGKVYIVDFNGARTLPINNDQNSRKELRALVAHKLGGGEVDLFAADTGKGQLLLYPNPTNPASRQPGQLVVDAGQVGFDWRPDGLSLYASGLVGTSTPSQYGQVNRVWALKSDPTCRPASGPPPQGCLPGGLTLPLITLDSDIRVDGKPARLEETLTWRNTSGALANGDLLVVSSYPAAVLLYHREDVLAALNDGANIAPLVFLGPADFKDGYAALEPVGIEAAPDGNTLLVSVKQGKILRFSTQGERLVPDFANGLGYDTAKIVRTVQEGEDRLIVAQRGYGKIRRFDILADGTGQLLDYVSDGVREPIDVATNAGADAAQVLPAGSDQSSVYSASVQALIEDVKVGGVQTILETVIIDPRFDASGHFLGGSFRFCDVNADLPCNVVPESARPYFTDGLPLWLVTVVNSAAATEGVVEVNFDQFHGANLFDGNCIDVPNDPQVWWGPVSEFGEDPGLEGATLINITSNCVNPPRGLGRDQSVMAVGTDARAPRKIVEAQVDLLAKRLSQATCIRDDIEAVLWIKLILTKVKVQLRLWGAAQLVLEAFEQVAENHRDAFAACTRNEWGALRANALNAAWQAHRAKVQGQ
jgi:hypothetical protein